MYFESSKCSFSDAVASYDVAVVGGGIVGCATARLLKIERPELRVALIEKEKALGRFLRLVSLKMRCQFQRSIKVAIIQAFYTLEFTINRAA